MALLPKTANFIDQIIFHHCARPWYVYVRTFFPSFVVLLYMVFIYDLEDLLRARGEKIVRGGKGSFRRGRHLTRKQRLIGRSGLIREGYRQQLKTLLVITTPLELIGFAFLLYGAVDEFYGTWMTLLQESDFCTQPIESGPLTRRRDDGRVNINPGGAAVLYDQLQQNRGNWSNSPIFVTLPEGSFSALAALTVTGPIGGITDVFLRIRVVGLIGTSDFESEHSDIADGEETDFIADASFFLPGVAGGVMTWEIVGPSVPVGLASKAGFLTVSRVG